MKSRTKSFFQGFLVTSAVLSLGLLGYQTWKSNDVPLLQYSEADGCIHFLDQSTGRDLGCEIFEAEYRGKRPYDTEVVMPRWMRGGE